MTAIISNGFTQVLDTNYAPSRREREEIRAIVQDPEQEIRRIDEEISRLQARRDELSRFVTSHRMLLSPFRRLPGELWGEIFVRCLPNGSLPVRSLSEAPLLLTCICRTWREVALNTPTLWNAVHISIPPALSYRGIEKPEDMQYSSLRALKAREQGLKQWLDRSGSLPLTLSLNALSTSERWGEDQSEQEKLKEKGCLDLMKMLTGFSRKWKSLSLTYFPTSFLGPLESLTAGDLPLLEEIRDLGSLIPLNPPLGYPVGIAFQPVVPRLCFPRQSPALRTLQITLRTSSDFDPVSVGWARLTVLNLTFRKRANGPRIFHRLAQLCPLLTDCTVDLGGWGLGPDHQPLPRNEWTYLRKLNFTLHAPDSPQVFGQPDTGSHSEVRNILESITTPALTHLHICYRYNAVISPDQESYDLITHLNADVSLYDFIVRSQCVLVCLELSFPLGPQFPMVLSILPSLTTISLDLLSSSDEVVTSHQLSQLDTILDSLMPVDDGATCPNLGTIQLSSCHSHNARTVLEFFDARAALGNLKTFTACFMVHSEADMDNLKSTLRDARDWRENVETIWEFMNCIPNYGVVIPREDPRIGLPTYPSWKEKLVL
ncbi:hypothetical protein V5O48_009426 [Marasmius crinis-equi]|uniref:F-box domain-containing protein n=1 Tax=Marasmius crinis-equi TaxID=585013 RepID=A0ABR3FB33_9AGAR